MQECLKGKAKIWRFTWSISLLEKSLRECAKHAEISLQRSFKWLHRILAALESSQNQIVLKSIVESDDMFLPIRKKDSVILIEHHKKEGKEYLN